jgi:thiamine biosynthesis lipoprotein
VLSLVAAAGYRVVNRQRTVELSRTFTVLGTFATVIVTAEQQEARALIQKADSLLTYLDVQLGRFNETGQLYRLNTSCSIPVDQELADLILKTDTIVTATDGCFDPSLGAVVQLWGFPEATSVPDSNDIIQALARTGWEARVHFTADSVTIDSGTVMDFGAIAKGYAVDRTYELLMQLGASECLVEVGGEVRCGSTTGRVWNIGIRHPRENSLLGIVGITSGAVATSGDYECYFVEDGVRYSHLIDRQTGYPSGNAASATVVAENCATADAVATAAAVAGPCRASDFADFLFTAMVIVTCEENGRCKTHEFGDVPWAE